MVLQWKLSRRNPYYFLRRGPQVENAKSISAGLILYIFILYIKKTPTRLLACSSLAQTYADSLQYCTGHRRESWDNLHAEKPREFERDAPRNVRPNRSHLNVDLRIFFSSLSKEMCPAMFVPIVDFILFSNFCKSGLLLYSTYLHFLT